MIPWVSVLSRGWTGLLGEAERLWNTGSHCSDLRPWHRGPVDWLRGTEQTFPSEESGTVHVSVVSSEVLMPRWLCETLKEHCPSDFLFRLMLCSQMIRLLLVPATDVLFHLHFISVLPHPKTPPVFFSFLFYQQLKLTLKLVSFQTCYPVLIDPLFLGGVCVCAHTRMCLRPYCVSSPEW